MIRNDLGLIFGGLLMMAGAGGTYLLTHETPKVEERALPKGNLTFGPVPQIVTPVPEVQSTLTLDALMAKGRELAPPQPKAEAQQTVEESSPVKVVRYSAVRYHKARRKHHARPAVRLRKKWAQSSAPSSLERLFNVR